MIPFARFYKISIQDALVYRWNIVFAIIGYMLSATVGIHIVQRIYEEGHQLGTYAEQPLLLYFLFVMVMYSLLYFGDAWAIVDEIHTGKIVSFLVKPTSYYWARIAIYLGKASVRFVTMIPALILGLLLLNINLNDLWQLHFLRFLPYFLIGLGLHMCVVIILGVLSFPLERASAAIFTFQTAIYLVGGTLLPLSLFPFWIQTGMKILPFHFLIYTPLSTLLGQTPFLPYFIGLGIDLIWLVLAILVMRLLWARGMKTYEGFGQ